jgi:hypothetical protein
MESVDWIYDERMGWKAVELVEQTKKVIEQSVKSRSLDEAKRLKIFESYLAKLSKITF